MSDIAAPIAVTLVVPTCSGSSSPDFDLYLYDAQGSLLASSLGTQRQETVAWGPPATTGTYRVRVYSCAGSGPYFFDVSAGMPKGAGLSLASDGAWAAVVVPPGGTADSLADPEQVTVTAGPVDL